MGASESVAADPTARPDVTLAEFVPVYLDRHAANVRPLTIVTLRERLAHATRAWGDVPLRAAWSA